MDTCDKCGKTAELFHNEASGLAYCETCDLASEADTADYSVVSDEGLHLFQHLSRDEAVELAAFKAGRHAVPTRIALQLQQLWGEYERDYERRLREARKARTELYITSYDGATADRLDEAVEALPAS